MASTTAAATPRSARTPDDLDLQAATAEFRGVRDRRDLRRVEDLQNGLTVVHIHGGLTLTYRRPR